MSGLIDDVSSVFSSVGDAISNVFSSGAGDAASAATDAASTASDVASTASDVSSAASSVPAGFNFATDAAGTAASSGDAISNAASYLDNTAAASYTAGVATGTFGDAGSALAPGSSYLGTTAYDAINNGEFNANTFGGLDPSSPAYTNMALATASMGPAAAQTSAGHGWFSGMFGGGSAIGAATDTGLGSLSKLMLGQMIGGLVSGTIQAVGAYKASQPKPPANFSGRTPGGGGGGLGMSTNGFGLTAGGSTPPPTGVPSALKPNALSEQLGGSGGLAPMAPPNGAPNLQQTVANSAGVGGLIPQGAVNYMKGPNNG